MPVSRRLRQRVPQVQGQLELHTRLCFNQKNLIKKSVAGGMAQQFSVCTALEGLTLAPSMHCGPYSVL